MPSKKAPAVLSETTVLKKSARPVRKPQQAAGRAQTEEAWEESQALLHAIVESTSDMIWSVDPENFGLLTFNCSMKDYFSEQRGLDIKVGDRPQELFPPGEFVERWQAMYQQALAQGAYKAEYQVFTGTHLLELHFNLLKRENEVFGISVFGQDITARKQAEAALQASEQKLRTLFDTLAEGIAVNQAIYNDQGKIIDYRILEVNKAFYQTADYEPGQVVGKLATQLYGMDSDLIQAFWEAHKEARAAIHSEMPSPRNHRTFFISTSPIQNDIFVTSFVDITDLKHKETALKESEEMLRSIFASTPDSITVVNLDGNIQLCNQAAADMHGYSSPEQMIGKSFIELVAPEEHLRAKEGLQQVRQQGMMKDVSFTGLKRNGETFSAELSVSIIKDDTGSQSGFVGITKDVGTRKQADAAVRTIAEQYRLLAENSPDHIVRFDLDGRLLLANRPVREGLELLYGENGFLGKTYRELGFPADQCDYWEQCQQKVIQTGLPFSTEYTYEILGDIRYFDWRLVPELDPAGQVVSILALSRDITERKQAETALLQKMEELERFQRLTVGREMKMIEMKKEINDLLAQLGRPEKYPLPPES